jgi:hypothetical protein
VYGHCNVTGALVFPHSIGLEASGDAQSYVNEIKVFVECVLNDTPLPITGLDGRTPVVMGLASAKSLAERRRVRLDEVE